jgi:hypothetical protein
MKTRPIQVCLSEGQMESVVKRMLGQAGYPSMIKTEVFEVSSFLDTWYQVERPKCPANPHWTVASPVLTRALKMSDCHPGDRVVIAYDRNENYLIPLAICPERQAANQEMRDGLFVANEAKQIPMLA